jgi:hypothetical protein
METKNNPKKERTNNHTTKNPKTTPNRKRHTPQNRIEITPEDLLLKPKKTFWDTLGTYSEFGTPKEVKEELDKLRHEDQ